MVSVCLPSDALLQHLPFYLGFSYLGREVSLHGCSSKAQVLLLTLDEGYLLTAAIPDLQCGIAPLGPPAPAQPPLLGLLLLATGPASGWLLRVTAPGLGHAVNIFYILFCLILVLQTLLSFYIGLFSWYIFWPSSFHVCPNKRQVVFFFPDNVFHQKSLLKILVKSFKS